MSAGRECGVIECASVGKATSSWVCQPASLHCAASMSRTALCLLYIPDAAHASAWSPNWLMAVPQLRQYLAELMGAPHLKRAKDRNSGLVSPANVDDGVTISQSRTCGAAWASLISCSLGGAFMEKMQLLGNV